MFQSPDKKYDGKIQQSLPQRLPWDMRKLSQMALI
jgi:hypothetical protein